MTGPTLESLQSRFDVVVQTVSLGGCPRQLARPRSADALIDAADFQLDERIPYWSDVWSSSWALIEELARRTTKPGTLLDLGCGVGLSAVAAAGMGYEVTATDYYGEALEFAAVNARLNRMSVAVRLVDWRAPPGDLGAFDAVIAADVLYERANVTLVAEMFARFVKPDGLGLCADPQRRSASGFLEACRARGLHVNCFVRQADDAGRLREIDVYAITRLSQSTRHGEEFDPPMDTDEH